MDIHYELVLDHAPYHLLAFFGGEVCVDYRDAGLVFVTYPFYSRSFDAHAPQGCGQSCMPAAYLYCPWLVCTVLALGAEPVQVVFVRLWSGRWLLAVFIWDSVCVFPVPPCEVFEACHGRARAPEGEAWIGGSNILNFPSDCTRLFVSL